MSSSAPVVTSVSTPTTDVMESLIAVIAQMSKPVLPDPQECATMRVSSSVSQMGAVSRPPGSVMVIQTVRMAAMNTTPARLAPAPQHSSGVIMETVCYAAGFVMGITTAGT